MGAPEDREEYRESERDDPFRGPFPRERALKEPFDYRQKRHERREKHDSAESSVRGPKPRHSPYEKPERA